MSIIPSDDARIALSDRLERFVKGRWVPEDGQPREMIDEVIAALRTPALDLRAWVQHKPRCASLSLRDYCRSHGGDGGIAGCPSCQNLPMKRDCTCGLDAALSAHDHLRPSGESAD